jgi:rare lipoprotein A
MNRSAFKRMCVQNIQICLLVKTEANTRTHYHEKDNLMKKIMLSLVLAMPLPALAECGMASYYGGRHAGKKTASGEIFRPSKLTAAHKSLPFGTRLKVTYKGKSIVVKVNDRGPFVKGRSLDLSEGAAKQLGFKSKGVAKVCYAKL